VSAAATDFCGICSPVAVAEILFIHRMRLWLSYVEVLANRRKLEGGLPNFSFECKSDH
jgi:hypothetical protein